MPNRLGVFASMDDVEITINNLGQAIKRTEEPYKDYMIRAYNLLIQANNILADLAEKHPNLEEEPNEYPELGGL